MIILRHDELISNMSFDYFRQKQMGTIHEPSKMYIEEQKAGHSW